MILSHADLVEIAQLHGLLYLIAMFVAATLYALWPSNRSTFTKAADSILASEDKPWG